MITDEMLRAAAGVSLEAYTTAFEADYDPESPHIFSKAFEKKLQKLIRKAKHPVFYRTVQRVAAVFLAVLLGLGIWLTASPTARAAFFSWVREIYEEHIVYRFGGETPTGVLPEYRPDWLPDGYAETQVIENNQRQNIIYTINGKNDKAALIFSCFFTHEDISLWASDYGEVIEVQINGMPGHFYTAPEEGDSCGLVWIDQNTGITFALSSRLSFDDMMHIAKSVKLVKTSK